MASHLTYKILNQIAQERDHQINEEGFTTEKDDDRTDRSLATAAAAYADAAGWDRTKRYDRVVMNLKAPSWWPWPAEWWKPTTRRRDLIKAASLIVAEIERLDRITAFGGDYDQEAGQADQKKG